MNKAINQLRLFLCNFSGEDDYILRRCSKHAQISLAAIGLFVLIIFIGCFISATAFTYSLFEENSLLSVPFGVFWALMVSIIYLLLLYTITPPILPGNYKKSKKITQHQATIKHRFFTLSMLLRMGFMLLLALIIAQPLSVYFLSKSTETSIEKYKLEQRARMIIVSDSLLIQNEITLFHDFENKVKLKSGIGVVERLEKDLSLIDLKISSDEQFVKSSFSVLDSINKIDARPFLSKQMKQVRDSLVVQLSILVDNEIDSDYAFKAQISDVFIKEESLIEDFDMYKANLIAVIDKKIDNYQQLNNLLNKSNFYIQKISILLKENPLSWLITLFVCVLFLLPIYLKFIIRKKTGYYEKKEDLERKIVVDAYTEFKTKYSLILSGKVNAYNQKHKDYLYSLLFKIKDIYPDSYQQHLIEIDLEYLDEPITKYEHWADCPFKTERKYKNDSVSNTENELLKLLYTKSKE